MTAKKNKTGKLDRAWIGYVIDLIVGPQLMLLGMREPLGAQKLQDIMIMEINKKYASTEYKFPRDTNQFVVEVSEMLWKMYNLFITAKLVKYLNDGVPAAPVIVNPGKQIVH